MIPEAKPTFLLYGNCQAGALAHIFGSDPTITAAYDVRYMPSFNDRNPSARDLLPHEIAAVQVLLEQVDPNVFPHHDVLPSTCTRLTFPSIDLNVLWPLICRNVYNDAPTPQRPWGRFPLSDRVIMDCVRRGLSAAETLDYYHTMSRNLIPDLRRQSTVEKARLAAREAKADVKISDFVFDQLARQNLFWTINHPTMVPLRELSRRLIERATPHARLLRDVAIDDTIAALPPEGPLAFFRVPIHPAVVDHFELEWYQAEDGPNYGLRYETRLTYEEYFFELTTLSLKVRNSQAAPDRERALPAQ